MKRTVIVLLLSSLLIQLFYGLYIVSSFYVNRDYIARDLCINRFDKIPVCKGSCYLEKQLSEHEEKQFPKHPSGKFKQFEWTFYLEESFTCKESAVFDEPDCSASFFTRKSTLFTFHPLIFHPPQTNQVIS